MALLGAAWIPLWFFLNLYLQQILGLSALASGLALLPMTVTIMIVMVGLSGKLIGKFGVKPNLVLGLLLLGVALLMFANLPLEGAFVANVLPASLLAAFGMALAYIPTTMTGMAGAKPEETGLASGLINTTYQIGSAIGLAIMVARRISRHGQDAIASRPRFGPSICSTCRAAVPRLRNRDPKIKDNLLAKRLVIEPCRISCLIADLSADGGAPPDRKPPSSGKRRFMLRQTKRSSWPRLIAWIAVIMAIAAGYSLVRVQTLLRFSTDNYAKYADADRWVCLPGRQDACSRSLKAIQLLENGSSLPVPPQPSAASTSVDCFYVYPTVTLSVMPGNPDPYHTDTSSIEVAAAAQAASFGSVCRVFAPQYRQATIAAYVLPESVRQMYIQVAASDVLAAFDYYLANHNQGRKIVLIGHSQGSEMLIKLIQGRFDASRKLREKLLLGIFAGIPVNVPTGQKVGGTFAHVPVCTLPGEVGCFIAFSSYADGSDPKIDARIPTPAGQERVCVNPATLDDPGLSPEARRNGRGLLQGTLLVPAANARGFVRSDAQTKSFTRLSGAFSSACATATDPRMRFLSIRQELASTDSRHGIVKLSSDGPWDRATQLLKGDTGLHVMDMQFPMQEMIFLVAARRLAS